MNLIEYRQKDRLGKDNSQQAYLLWPPASDAARKA